VIEPAGPRVRIDTSGGSFVVAFDSEGAPKLTENFLALVGSGYYVGQSFYESEAVPFGGNTERLQMELQAALSGLQPQITPQIQAIFARLQRARQWNRPFGTGAGSPQGTPSGGPGYTLPLENLDAPIDSGTLLADLEGDEASGARFWVLTEPTPDATIDGPDLLPAWRNARSRQIAGRYPVLGRVVEGIEVAGRLTPSDTIVRLEILE
jgi:cyclophilin family peptidyl-prolyl cis-trans isomerase